MVESLHLQPLVAAYGRIWIKNEGDYRCLIYRCIARAPAAIIQSSFDKKEELLLQVIGGSPLPDVRSP